VLDHITRTSVGPSTVVSVPGSASTPDVELDYVGNFENAAIVISRLHRGEKRLVFVDSRAGAERLASLLRSHDVNTFVSHGSLGVEERRSAERAFAEARDCVIVATSTLELGIDVGDLDRVIQLDAPGSVASFLQRLGRTGRRPGTQRNALFLATSADQFLRCAGLLLQWSRGFVEPIAPPPNPFHLVAQQALALCLQEGAIGRYRWTEHLGSPFLFGPEAAAATPEIVDHLLEEGYLVDDGGLLSIGGTAEDSFGHKHFLELLAVFTSPPLLSVRQGRTEIGLVPDEVLLVRPSGYGAGGPPTLLLAGRTWAITDIDWPRRIVQVEPAEGDGVAKWFGGSNALSAPVAQGIRDVLTGTDPAGVSLSERAQTLLAADRDDYRWVPQDGSVLRYTDGKLRLWTFAGWRANAWLAAALRAFRTSVSAFDGSSVALDPDAPAEAVREGVHAMDPDALELDASVLRAAIDGLKFTECLPTEMALAVLAQWYREDDRLVGIRDGRLDIYS
jgi:ATP-dependent helicase Lhr and Lhr-like helicase